jgi:hypothetical protein
MTSRSLVPPTFSIPPDTYSAVYFNDLVRSLSLFVLQVQQPGVGRNTELVLTNLQSNDVGLEVGSLFEVDGTVKITRSFNPHPAGSAGTGAVGTVTVSTP